MEKRQTGEKPVQTSHNKRAKYRRKQCSHFNHLWIEIESLQCVNNQGVLRQSIIHDHVEAVQERRGLNNGLVVGIV